MDKQTVDTIITEFFTKIYGFAVKKAFSYDEAEDLCAEIVQEVYRSLLAAEDVVNREGYIWRISEHTYAKYVSSRKKQQGVSIDGMEIPVVDRYSFDSGEEEKISLRQAIAYLSKTRRKIIYSFYFENKTIASISKELQLAEGTVKWHLNRARNELKEAFSMERKIGKLGLNPKETAGFSHNGTPGANGGPEFYLGDKLNLNIVYSVYEEPKTKEQIAQELGVTPVYLEDKVDYLEGNGFLVPVSGGRYTTFVQFSPEKYSLELEDKIHEMKQKTAELLVEEYVPLVRQAVAEIHNVYIPGGSRELLEAAAVWAGLLYKCGLETAIDVSRYTIKTTDGGCYMARVDFPAEPVEKDYTPKYDAEKYWACGVMGRSSDKYPNVRSWSVDSRYCSREGAWENNWNADYDYLYELVKGDITDNTANAEKFARLRERKYITDDNQVAIMMVQGEQDEFFEKLPAIPESVLNKMRDMALENAMMQAKYYPPQMQDLVVYYGVECFPDNEVALRVLDILYENGTFRPLTEAEKITSQLIMFSGVLPSQL